MRDSGRVARRIQKGKYAEDGVQTSRIGCYAHRVEVGWIAHLVCNFSKYCARELIPFHTDGRTPYAKWSISPSSSTQLPASTCGVDKLRDRIVWSKKCESCMLVTDIDSICEYRLLRAGRRQCLQSPSSEGIGKARWRRRFLSVNNAF